MPAYNFKPQFASMVESGQKTQTIRKVRKYPTKPKTIIYLNTGMRTKSFRRLGIGMIISIEIIVIYKDHFVIHNMPDTYVHYVEEDDAGLMLAKADGFDSWDDFVEFFKTHYGLPFEGEIIKWRLLKEHDFGYPEKEEVDGQ